MPQPNTLDYQYALESCTNCLASLTIHNQCHYNTSHHSRQCHPLPQLFSCHNSKHKRTPPSYPSFPDRLTPTMVPYQYLPAASSPLPTTPRPAQSAPSCQSQLLVVVDQMPGAVSVRLGCTPSGLTLLSAPSPPPHHLPMA